MAAHDRTRTTSAGGSDDDGGAAGEDSDTKDERDASPPTRPPPSDGYHHSSGAASGVPHGRDGQANGTEMEAEREYKSAEAMLRDDKRNTEAALRLASEDPGDDEKTHKIFFLGKRNQKFRDEKGEFKGVSQQLRLQPWKLKERMRTVSVGLVLCLNIGVDPPDVGTKPVPCAKLECWVDPSSMASPRALEEIGKALQAAYERWQPRAKYKQCLDPTVPDVKKLCVSLRKAAKHERVLLHYNGHGVPRPTSNGEVWVFNKTYTQYIPLSIYDLHSWLSSPATLVLDCTAAGLVVDAFASFVKQKEDEAVALISAAGPGGATAAKAKQTVAKLKDCIILGSCSGKDTLPMNAELPADLFTACLTSPLKVALRFFASTATLTRLPNDITDKIPGRQHDRKTPLGELNWIFTAITDTIAWTVLPRDLFQKLFRQDLLVASLFRNYLVADRILRSYGCTPVSYPKLPPTHKHPMWEAWDLAAEHCLLQLDKFIKHGVKFQHSPFFQEHLTAFEVWLEVGCQESSPPLQLPIVLQVLLSQVHRRRALVLLARFLGKGAWAVNLALSVGIFPYVLKLLQNPSAELRDVLVFIWTKILAVDRTCQIDLVKDNYHEYFLAALAPPLPDRERGISGANAAATTSTVTPTISSPIVTHPTTASPLTVSGGAISTSASSTSATAPGGPSVPSSPSVPPPPSAAAIALDRQRAMAGFVLSVLCDHHPDGQRKLLAARAFDLFHLHMSSDTPLVRRWMVLCVAKLWADYDAAKMAGVHAGVSEKLCTLLADPVPEVRAASLYALGSFMGATEDENPRRAVELAIAKSAIPLATDGSAMVRDELVNCLAQLVFSQQDEFCILALEVEADHAPTPRRAEGDSKTESGSTTTSSGMRPAASTPNLSTLTPSSRTTVSHSSQPVAALVSPTAMSAVSPTSASVPFGSPEDTSVTTLLLPAREKRVGLATIKDKDSPAGQREMIWKVVLQLCYDPFPAVATAANAVRAYVAALNASLAHRREGNRMGGTGLHRISERWDPSRDGKDGEFHAMDDSHLLRRSGSGNNMRRATSTQTLADMVKQPGARDDAKVLPRRTGDTSSRLSRDSSSVGAGSTGGPTAPDSPPSVNRMPSSAGAGGGSSPEELRQRIPESLIYLRSCDHFLYPVMDPQLDEEKNFQQAINRQWRSKRNIRLMEEAKQLKKDGYGTWSFNTAKTFTFGEPTVAGVFDQVAVLQSGFEQVSKVIFHPFENMLFASDGKHNIGVWDFKEHQCLNVFHRPEMPKLTSLQLINPHDTSLLMTGADDGVVKLYRNTHLKGEQEVCAAWTAVRCPARGGCGLVLDWQQNLGRLLAGGHSDVIRIWDAEQDQCIREMPLQGVNTSVTSLSSTTEGHVVVAGCLDGTIRLYDTRREMSLVASTIRHSRRCVHVHLQRGGFDDGKLISGGAGGEVILTDLRMTKEALKTLTIFDAKGGKSLDALAVHDWAPILACGSTKQVIKVVDTHGTNINTIKYYKGFMGHRIGAIKSLAFHPHQLMLAAGANNSFISLLAALPNG